MAWRIAVIGPESTGKSTLCELLAGHYKTLWVPEYARTYIAALTVPYTQNDVEAITVTQLQQEDEAIQKANRFLFIDTEMIVAKVWFEDVFKSCPAWIEKRITENPYDFYLLSYPDIPWKIDKVRENENRREYFFNWYLKELQERALPFAIIKGSGEKRFNNSIHAIESYFLSMSTK